MWLQKHGAFIASMFTLFSLAAILGVLVYVERTYSRDEALHLEHIRHQNYDEGFGAGMRATMKHVHMVGTNMTVDLHDVLSENHGPKP